LDGGVLLENIDDFSDWPSVSILVTVYNGSETVVRCLDSLLKLDYPNFDIWILDDDSTDDTVEKVRLHFSQIHLHCNLRRLGFGPSLNNGVRLSQGEIIGLVNVDAWVDSQWLKSLVTVLTSDPLVALAGSKVLEPDGNILQHAGAYVALSGFTQHYGRGEADRGQYNQIRECDYICAAAVVFKRDLFEKIGGFDRRFYPIYFEDVDLCFRLREKGYKVLYVPQAIAWHMESAASGKASRKYFYRYHKSRLQFVFKWLLKDNGLWRQLQLEWEVFRKPWPLGVRLAWIGAFFAAVWRTMKFHLFCHNQLPPLGGEGWARGANPHQDLLNINQSYDTFTVPKERTLKYWIRHFVGRVIGYYIIRQREFNTSVVRLFNHSHGKMDRIETQQQQITQQLNQLSDQLKKLQKRQESLLSYLCETLDSTEQGKKQEGKVNTDESPDIRRSSSAIS